MGNHVGIEREPATLVEVLECKEDNGEHEAKVKFNNKNNKHEFSSTLHLWRFFADPDNSENIKNAPVLLTNSFKGFDSLQCYLILHIFLEGQKFTTHASPTTPPTSSENDATVANLLSSSTEALTPRGLSNCLEEALIVNSKASDTGLSYNIYVWHGKDSLNPIRAVAMAKRFELANALKAKKLTQTLFLRGEKIPLTSVFRYDPVPSQKGSNGFGDEGINNHLFRQLLRRDSSELHQGKAPQQSGGSMIKATTFSRLNQVFPENGSVTPPTSPSKDLQGRSRSEGSLKDLIEHATKETHNNNKHDTHIEQDDDDDDDEEEDASERKKDKKKKKKSKKDSKRKAKRAAKLSKTTSISQPSLVTKAGLPALDLTKKPTMGKPGLSINIKGLDKVNQAEQQEAPQKKEAITLDLRRGSMPPQSSFGDPSFTDSENKIKSEKLKYFDIICSKITDDLYLGSQTVSRDKTLLNETGITHILNCAGSICPEYYPGEFVYRTLYLTDGVKEDILCLLYDVIEWIDEVVSNKGKVFIHCQQGVSRSSAIMIGYLMWKKDWNYEEAQLFVKARRGVSSPNTGFICQLLFLERRLHDPKRETRIYHITNHSRHDTGFLVGKNTRSFPISEISNGNSKSCYIVQVPECFYIWVGGKCEPGSFEVAKQTVRRVQAFEKATQNVHIITQGEEENEFKEFIAKLGQ